MNKDGKYQLEFPERMELIISYCLKIIIVFTIIFGIFRLNLFLIASSLIILFFSALPAIAEKTFKITLPVEVDLILTIFISAHFILGEVQDYYNRYWWFDLFLHMSSGILVGLVGFIIIFFFLYTYKVKAHPLLVSVFSISFSLSAGVFWEIFEFAMDSIFGFNMQKTGNVDTMSDLIIDFLGACIVGFWTYRYINRNEDGVIKILVKRFIQFNVRLKDKRSNISRRRLLKRKNHSLPPKE